MVKQLNSVSRKVQIPYLPNFRTKMRLKKQISNLQLSHQTVARRVEIISRDIFAQLLSDLNNASGFSLALDESCDVTYTEQLIIWVRFDTEDKFREELLALVPMKNTTKGEDRGRACYMDPLRENKVFCD